ncbi:5-oxoprolinase subunit B family protein [Micromonospora sp. LOL_024]|uniref:5-oxoprolinase subunit B family protein n=1 Tax=Micromonospora sp. LOL_024 TaxID=3345412 RepID=UPI003A8B8C57
MRIRPAGTHALLLDFAGTQPEPVASGPVASEPVASGPAGGAGADVAALVQAWRVELWRRRDQGELIATEIVPAASTVLLDGVLDPAATAARIEGWLPVSPMEPGKSGTDLVEVPVWYDGEDLSRVAEYWQVDVPAVVRRLRQTEFRVAFCGFAPGFGYLTGLPAALAVPRLATPRPRVPAGSVALADQYAGIYPTASPGGWLLVGRTAMTLFDVHADPPARLTPGTQVRLVPA